MTVQAQEVEVKVGRQFLQEYTDHSPIQAAILYGTKIVLITTRRIITLSITDIPGFEGEMLKKEDLSFDSISDAELTLIATTRGYVLKRPMPELRKRGRPRKSPATIKEPGDTAPEGSD